MTIKKCVTTLYPFKSLSQTLSFYFSNYNSKLDSNSVYCSCLASSWVVQIYNHESAVI